MENSKQATNFTSLQIRGLKVDLGEPCFAKCAPQTMCAQSSVFAESGKTQSLQCLANHRFAGRCLAGVYSVKQSRTTVCVWLFEKLLSSSSEMGALSYFTDSWENALLRPLVICGWQSLILALWVSSHRRRPFCWFRCCDSSQWWRDWLLLSLAFFQWCCEYPPWPRGTESG